MGKAISVTVGGKIFPTKGELRKFMQALVDRYQIGDYLKQDDVNFCLSLFERHADYPQKLAPGVVRIQILIQEHGTRGFQIHKNDGVSDNISWSECITPRKQ